MNDELQTEFLNWYHFVRLHVDEKFDVQANMSKYEHCRIAVELMKVKFRFVDNAERGTGGHYYNNKLPDLIVCAWYEGFEGSENHYSVSVYRKSGESDSEFLYRFYERMKDKKEGK